LTEVLGGSNIDLAKNVNIQFTQEGAYLYKITSN